MRWLLVVALLGTQVPAQDGELGGLLDRFHNSLAQLQEAQDPLQRRLRRIEATLRKSRKKGKQSLVAFMDELRLKEDEGSRTAYNDAVTVARRLKMKVDYATRTAGKRLLCDIPLGRRWTGAEKKLESILQCSRTGAFLRNYHFRRYDGDRKVLDLAKWGVREIEMILKKVKIRRTHRKGRLSAHFKRVDYFELGGLNREGRYRHYHCYFVKGKGCIYRVLIRTHGKFEGFDPQAAALLGSLREA